MWTKQKLYLHYNYEVPGLYFFLALLVIYIKSKKLYYMFKFVNSEPGNAFWIFRFIFYKRTDPITENRENPNISYKMR